MKTLLILVASFFTISVFAQTTDNISPVQAGTAKLVNGKATIQLDETTLSYTANNSGSAYFVTLTPIGNCGALKLDEKGNFSFTVTNVTTGTPDGSFDYVVFVKYPAAPLNQNMQPVKTVLTPGK